ncbi:MAG: hypothetical protein ACOYMN_05135 [Roseimicrobium sp.]
MSQDNPKLEITTGRLHGLHNDIVALIKKETTEIDNRLDAIGKDIQTLLLRRHHSSWDEFHSILVNLRGKWIEYIPRLAKDGCEYSIASFALDVDGRHCFSGKNFHKNGDYKYSWTTVKLLPPIRHDLETLYLYYIYRREGNPAFADQHGFGKLVAKKTGDAADSYQFVEGFFFNEAAESHQGGLYQMHLKRLDMVSDFVGQKTSEIDEANPKSIAAFFAAISQKKFFDEASLKGKRKQDSRPKPIIGNLHVGDGSSVVIGHQSAAVGGGMRHSAMSVASPYANQSIYVSKTSAIEALQKLGEITAHQVTEPQKREEARKLLAAAEVELDEESPDQEKVATRTSRAISVLKNVGGGAKWFNDVVKFGTTIAEYCGPHASLILGLFS